MSDRLVAEQKARQLVEQKLQKEEKSVDHIVRKSVAQFFESAAEKLKNIHLGQSGTLNGVVGELRGKMSAEGIPVTFDEATGTLNLPEELLFKSGSASIQMTPGGDHAMDVLARELRLLLPCHVSNLAPEGGQPCQSNADKFDTVLIEGHADHVRLSMRLQKKYGSNLNLSSARAAAVYEAIVSREPDIATALSGTVERATAGQHLIGAVGYGDTRPTSGAAAANDEHLRGVDLRFIASPKH